MACHQAWRQMSVQTNTKWNPCSALFHCPPNTMQSRVHKKVLCCWKYLRNKKCSTGHLGTLKLERKALHLPSTHQLTFCFYFKTYQETSLICYILMSLAIFCSWGCGIEFTLQLCTCTARNCNCIKKQTDLCVTMLNVSPTGGPAYVAFSCTCKCMHWEAQVRILPSMKCLDQSLCYLALQYKSWR